MIPTSPERRPTRASGTLLPRTVAFSRGTVGRPRWRLAAARAAALALAASLALGGCTNSRLVIAPLYDRLDDRMLDALDELAEFDERQRAEVRARIDVGHLWHRRDELPRYAALLDEVAASVAVPGDTSRADVRRWAEEIEARSVAARACHPVNFSLGLIRGLDDEQLDAVERHLAEERTENREKYVSRTADERRARRQRNVEKWARRIGIELDAAQRAMLRSALEEQVSLRRQYYRLSDAWKEELFRIARDRKSPEFEARLTRQFDALWQLLESAYPDEWRRNQVLWRDFAHRFVESMSETQRATASAWMAKMAETLRTVSRDEVSPAPSDDPALGCLVGADPGERAAGGDGRAGGDAARSDASG